MMAKLQLKLSNNKKGEQMGKLISIWGAPDTGKTLLSFKLASCLLAQDKSCLLILTNTITPDLPIIQPTKIASHMSIGELLLFDNYTEEKILSYTHSYGENKNFGILGYVYKDNGITHAHYLEDITRQLLYVMTTMVDFVIVDGVSDIINSTITKVALEIADVKLKVLCAELKSLVYLESNKLLINSSNYDEFITVINNVYDNQPKELYMEKFKSNVVIPHLETLRKQFEDETEKLLKPITGKEGKLYEASMISLLDAIERKGINVFG